MMRDTIDAYEARILELEDELDRLREVERLARAVVARGDTTVAYAGLICSFCNEHALTNEDGDAIHPIIIIHADDCPWTLLRAALGEDDKDAP
jgi:hypothetical protein